MQRLLPGQAVILELDPELASGQIVTIACRTRSLDGSVATLEGREDLAIAVRLRLKRGALCFLTFEHGHGPVALRGAVLAVPGSDQIEFVAVDGVKVTERRGGGRIPFVTPVEMTVIDSDLPAVDPIQTVTSNLSIGGALIARHPRLSGERWTIALSLPDVEDRIHCEAALVRASDSHMGIAFAKVRDVDQVRIARVLASRVRRVASAATPS